MKALKRALQVADRFAVLQERSPDFGKPHAGVERVRSWVGWIEIYFATHYTKASLCRAQKQVAI